MFSLKTESLKIDDDKLNDKTSKRSIFDEWKKAEESKNKDEATSSSKSIKF